MPQDGAHDVHLGVTGRAVAALGLNCLQNRRRGGQRQAGAAVFLGDQGAKVAALGQRADEIRGIPAFLIKLAPIFAGNLAAQFPDFFADFRVGIGDAMSLSWQPPRTGLPTAYGVCPDGLATGKRECRA